MKTFSRILLSNKYEMLTFYLLLSFTYAVAFDGQKKGFYLGLELGSGYSGRYYSLENSTSKSDQNRLEQEYATYLGDIKVGLGVTNKILVYLNYDINLINPNEQRFISSILGLGSEFHFKEKTPNLFIKGGIGYSQWFYLGQKETNKYLKANGFGFTLGPGFQIFHFLGIEADFYYARTVNNRTVHEYSYVGMIPQLTNTIEYKEIYRIVCFRFTVKLDLL